MHGGATVSGKLVIFLPVQRVKLVWKPFIAGILTLKAVLQGETEHAIFRQNIQRFSGKGVKIPASTTPLHQPLLVFTVPQYSPRQLMITCSCTTLHHLSEYPACAHDWHKIISPESGEECHRSQNCRASSSDY